MTDTNILMGVDKEGPSEVKVTDKRLKVNVVPSQKDVFQSMTDKVFAFMVEQPEFYTILQYPRAVRKAYGQELAKIVTRFPHFQKAGFRGTPQA